MRHALPLLAAVPLALAATPARADFLDDVRRTFQTDIPRTFQHDIPRAFGAEDKRTTPRPPPRPARPAGREERPLPRR